MIILVVIFILLMGIGYVYYATDLLKNNQELFFKYVAQIGEEDFIDVQLKQYWEKQKNTPYQMNGKITANTDTLNVNDLNVTFNGEVDTANSQLIQNISLNYSNNVSFPFNYKKIGDTIGIQTKYIGNKYVTTKENENLLMDETNNDFEKLKEFSNVSFSQEDKQHIKDTYWKSLNQELQESNFSKIEESDSKGYRLTLSGEKVKSILVKLLETLKNDPLTLDKMNEFLKIQKNSLKITTSDIDNVIREINNDSEWEQENLEITVYQTKGEMNRLLLKTNDLELKLEKSQNKNNNLQYNVAIQSDHNNQIEKIEFVAKFVGLQTLDNITEEYQLLLQLDNKKYEYEYSNAIQFVEQANIEEFNNDNSMMLNEAEEEQRNEFINAVIERIEAVNRSQMEELGLEENENPLQYVIPEFDSYIGNKEIDELEVNAFNQKFENYESTNLQGVTVKGLLSTIQLNNESQEKEDRKIKEIHFDGEEYQVNDQNILLLKGEVEAETAYRVEFERDEDTGIIYRAVINKK